MIYGSRTFRFLLGLLVALWSPACLCSNVASARGGGKAQTPTKLAHCHHGDDENEHDANAPADHDHHGPCKDHKDSGCECPQLAVSLDKADLTLKSVDRLLAVSIAWTTEADWRLWGPCVSFRTQTRAVDRPPTSLLSQHCALIV